MAGLPVVGKPDWKWVVITAVVIIYVLPKLLNKCFPAFIFIMATALCSGLAA